MIREKIRKSYLEILVGDITKQDTDAVVNAANKQLAPGGGVAGAIHKAAGKDLWEECKKLGGCNTGEAKLTRGFNLPALYIIHTVGPVYSGSSDDPKKLKLCYEESLKLAEKNNIKSISFPAISTGYFGYPIYEATDIALKTIIDYLKSETKIELVMFVLYDSKNLELYKEILDSILKNTN
jgi:O-acetyl-ADP-ribose deacetylase (regulator of RNase III)